MVALLILLVLSVVECSERNWWVNQKDPFGLGGAKRTKYTSESPLSTTFSWTKRTPPTTSWTWLSPPPQNERCRCVQRSICLEEYQPVSLKISGPRETRIICPRGEVCCVKTQPLNAHMGLESGNYVDGPDFDQDVGGPSTEAILNPPRGGVTETILDPDDFDGEDSDEGPIQSHHTCGVSDSTFLIDEKAGFPREGDSALFGEFPWMLGIIENDPIHSLTTFTCGAVLIEETFALTAAHCVDGKDPNSLSIKAGFLDILSDEVEERAGMQHQIVGVSNFTIHQRYMRVGLRHDIALILLKKPIKMYYHIRKICLPRPNDKYRGNCVASGWGMRKNTVSPSAQSIMKKVNVRLVRHKECNEMLKKTDLGPNYSLSGSTMCAKSTSAVDTHFSDGGGPMVCMSSDKPDRYVLAGITSWGKFDFPDAPGAYVSVRKYVNWIEEEEKVLLGM